MAYNWELATTERWQGEECCRQPSQLPGCWVGAVEQNPHTSLVLGGDGAA